MPDPPLMHSGCVNLDKAFASTHLSFLVYKMSAAIPSWKQGLNRDSRVRLGKKVLNICISNSSFLPCARYRGQCFRTLDSRNNEDAGVCPGDFTHHRLPSEQASHHHRSHQASQRGGQVRHMLGAATARGESAGREVSQSSVWPDQLPPSTPHSPPGQEWGPACWRPHPVHRWHQHGTLLIA